MEIGFLTFQERVTHKQQEVVVKIHVQESIAKNNKSNIKLLLRNRIINSVIIDGGPVMSIKNVQ